MQNDIFKVCDSLLAVSDKMEYLESQTRRNNLVFDGIQESQGETWSETEEKIKKVVKEKLQLQREVEMIQTLLSVKGVNFYGPCSEFVVSGSDCGHIYLWDKNSARVVQFMEGDRGGVVNCLEPHPHLPGLATSGLDHDVKLWAPTAENPTTLKGLKEVMKKNKRERDEDSVRHGDQYDTQLLWFLMRHMRNRRPQRARRGEGGEGDTDESWSSPDSSDEEEGGPDHVQCMSS
ncbi:DDB1- and CUL4-associated factor 8-like [Carassius carassius]|uniref:DDB1- and CUL4-associated factor 8-like n=1 Tax=Carassius carassius TaxID=217509 RepID=UPI002868F60E|nr:DDB1- and CUL4-associated factor 8-like [Carassius carassius]